MPNKDTDTPPSSSLLYNNTGNNYKSKTNNPSLSSSYLTNPTNMNNKSNTSTTSPSLWRSNNPSRNINTANSSHGSSSYNHHDRAEEDYYEDENYDPPDFRIEDDEDDTDDDYFEPDGDSDEEDDDSDDETDEDDDDCYDENDVEFNEPTNTIRQSHADPAVGNLPEGEESSPQQHISRREKILFLVLAITAWWLLVWGVTYFYRFIREI